MFRTVMAALLMVVVAGCGRETPSTPAAVTGISYVGVSVGNLEAAVDFYRDPAGLSLVDDSVCRGPAHGTGQWPWHCARLLSGR